MINMLPLPKDDPRVVAFAAYKDSDDYANTRRWALHKEPVDGFLWAAFIAGYAARLTPTPEPWDTLYDAIKHGDDEHRAWLKEAIENHRNGLPVPPPRGKGASPTPEPSLREALHHLQEARTTLVKMAYGRLDSDDLALPMSAHQSAVRNIDAARAALAALSASPAEPEEATEATHWVFHGKDAHVYTMRTACGKDYRYPVKGTDYAAHRVTCPDCRAALRSAASGWDTV